jgi:DNA replication protein DnaC
MRMIPENKIKRIKAKIKDQCKYCDNSCIKCEAKCNRIDKYYLANIPAEYWSKSFKDFAGDKNFKESARGILRDIDAFYDAGKSVIFAGNLGTGKTYTACCILKLGITNGYASLYTTMADVVANMLSPSVDTPKYYEELIKKDFLVIDEFSSHWIFPSERAEQTFGTSLEYVLRTRFQNQLPTILCSNDNDLDQIFGGFFAKSFKSLRSRHVDVFFVGGKDFRRSKC